jgi:hypothetical protein
MLKGSSSALVIRDPGSPPGRSLAPSSPPRPERSRPHHSYDDLCGCLRTIFPGQPSYSRGMSGTRRSMLGGLEAGQRRGARIPCKVTGVPIYQKGSGGPQKPFSSLSEGVRHVFTTHTEAGELVCVLRTPTSSESSSPLPIRYRASLCGTRTCRCWLPVLDQVYWLFPIL